MPAWMMVVVAIGCGPKWESAEKTEDGGEQTDVGGEKDDDAGEKDDEAGAPSPALAVGFVDIESDRPASVYVGNTKIGVTPLKHIPIPPGEHRVLALELENGIRRIATVVVVSDQERRIVFEFSSSVDAPEPQPVGKAGKRGPPSSAHREGAEERPSIAGAGDPAPSGPVGFVDIESDRPAIVYVGKTKVRVGTTPLKHIPIPPGEHSVLAMDVENGARKATTVVVVDGEESHIVIQFR
jgi:hypothetical protein